MQAEPATQAGLESQERSSLDKQETLVAAYQQIIEVVDDMSRPGVADTPRRAAVAMQFLTRGYDQTLDEVVNNALFPTDNREMIIVQDIELYSLCEHHMLPFIGRCHVGYIPDGKVLGLSKVARIVDMFARAAYLSDCQRVEGSYRRPGHRGDHRSPASVHDDARGGEAELTDEIFRHDRRVPGRSGHPIGVSESAAALIGPAILISSQLGPRSRMTARGLG
jgi:hypothetical protein